MRRKDCDNSIGSGTPCRVKAAGGAVRCCAASLLLASLLAGSVDAGSIRLWPTAVVVGDTIRLSDVCELSGFDADGQESLSDLVIGNAPQASGSRVIHLDLVRTALRRAGLNMATVTVRGATRCDVSRPAATLSATGPDLTNAVIGRRSVPEIGGDHRTLREAIVDFFDRELQRYGGTADVLFENSARHELDLAGPAYQFHVQRRQGSPLGLVQVVVQVSAGGSNQPAMPDVTLVTQVSLVRNVVSARRAINQGSTVRPGDVEMMPVTFTRLDKLGLDDTARVVGQRAKRFVEAGDMVHPAMLEEVPLITRGQLVSLTSVSGPVRVVTTATATEEGLLGESITLRATDNRRVAYEAVVVGPGRAQMGGSPIPAGALATRSGS